MYEQMNRQHDDCPAGSKNCIWNDKNDDEDYCFSPRMRFDPHAKCVKKVEEKSDEKDYYIREIRDRYMPAFTLEQTKLYMSLNPPSSYICCSGCKDPEYCRYDDNKCDCCSDQCRCCAGVCFH